MTTMAGAGRRGWYHGWNIVAVCILSQVAANGLPINAYSLFLHDWTTDLHVPVSSLQLGLAGCGLLSSLGSPFAGILADRYPAKGIFVAGLLAMILFCFGISFVTALWQLVVLYALLLPVGLTLATSLPANAVVSRWFVRRLGLALGLTAFGLGIAGVVMPPLIAAVMPALGWRAIWRIGGVVIAFVILPLVLLVIRDRPRERDGLYYMEADGAAAAPHVHGGGGPTPVGLRWRDILAKRNFWMLAIAFVPMLGLYGGTAQNLAPLVASHGFSSQTASVMLSLLSLSTLAATLGGGILSDRLGNRIPLAGLAFATALGGVILAVSQGIVPLAIGAMLAGFGGGFWPLLAAAAAVEFGALAVGRVFGLLALFVPVAVLTPVMVAKAQESTGSYSLVLLIMATLAAIGGVAALMLREKRGGHVAGAEPAAVA
jgi:OFA family oxalate/formate antiporter-like MFS transporter